MKLQTINQAPTLLNNTSDINKAITGISKAGAQLDSIIQLTALSVLKHISLHHDTTLADKLVNAMPKSGRKLALVEFLLAYGTFSKLDSSIDKEAIKAGRYFKNDKTKTLDLQAAIDKPWYAMKKEAPVLTAFDAHASVKALMARLTAANTSGLEITNKAQALNDAKALVELLSK